MCIYNLCMNFMSMAKKQSNYEQIDGSLHTYTHQVGHDFVAE